MHAENDLGAALTQLLHEFAIVLQRAVADFGFANAHCLERFGEAKLLVNARIDAGRVGTRAQRVVAQDDVA